MYVFFCCFRPLRSDKGISEHTSDRRCEHWQEFWNRSGNLRPRCLHVRIHVNVVYQYACPYKDTTAVTHSRKRDFGCQRRMQDDTKRSKCPVPPPLEGLKHPPVPALEASKRRCRYYQARRRGSSNFVQDQAADLLPCLRRRWPRYASADLNIQWPPGYGMQPPLH